ncbi:MAG: cupin domain-containing protein [Gallionellaceae bacterium]|jgi:50S ribosomal protein L16 3-hydroxylase|nr:cupin domain-containing protein [Gallionellaceae bacterium]
MKKPLPFLGNFSAQSFLRTYWQKKPLLIRNAFPHFNGLLDPRQLLALACDPDAQSRLVTRRGNRWQLQHGPFAPEDFPTARATKWTTLVQGVNHFLPAGAELLRHFDFIPHARLDDLMVSYAPKGGGVGPHFDAYDVFLLQGSGQRRWQISTQKDRTLIDGAPLRILKNFEPEQEWVLEAGDMLYLPPQCAHNGVAETDDCMTYSIGFRTPSWQELGEQFLVYLQDRIRIDGMYADPDLKLQSHPSEISADMLRQVKRAIGKIRWERRDIADFLGSYLSEPKPHIFFDPPGKPLDAKRFARAVRDRGVALDLKSQMLCHDGVIFINGIACDVGKTTYRCLRHLADARRLNAATKMPAEAEELLYEWYLNGYVMPAKRK